MVVYHNSVFLGKFILKLENNQPPLGEDRISKFVRISEILGEGKNNQHTKIKTVKKEK